MLRLRFTVHSPECITGDVVSRIRAVVESHTVDYLFENGGIDWLKSPKQAGLTKGCLDCKENVENAYILVRALWLASKEVPGIAARVVDSEQGTDFLWEETCEDDENDEDEDARVNERVSTFLYDGKLAVVRDIDDVTAARILQQPQSEVMTRIRFDAKRLAKLVNRFSSPERLVLHSKHVVKVSLPHTLAAAVTCSPLGPLAHTVPRAAFVYVEEDYLDEELKPIINALGSMPRVECMVRFTRLSYASIRAKCERCATISISEALTEGFARLIRYNDEFETKFAKYRKVLEQKNYFGSSGSDGNGKESLELKARATLFNSRTVDEYWVSPQNLRKMLLTPPSGSGTLQLPLATDDEDEWLLNEGDGEDNEENESTAWERVGRDMKHFMEDIDEKREGNQEITAAGMGMKLNNTKPVSFSVKRFFRILGQEDQGNDGSDEE